MKLYYFDVLNPRKVCALARHLKLPVEFVHVNLGKGEHKTQAFLAMNPNGKVPVLVDGDVTLWESNAILCYLAHKAGSDLWPTDTRQFEVLRWLMWDATELRFAAVLEAHLRGRRYLVGDALSVADFAVAITLPYAQQARLPLQDFPEIRRWHAQMNELPAWREPFPELAGPAALAKAA
jgi:glutathione S-transferase